jgi:hypothetical protein
MKYALSTYGTLSLLCAPNARSSAPNLAPLVSELFDFFCSTEITVLSSSSSRSGNSRPRHKICGEISTSIGRPSPSRHGDTVKPFCWTSNKLFPGPLLPSSDPCSFSDAIPSNMPCAYSYHSICLPHSEILYKAVERDAVHKQGHIPPHTVFPWKSGYCPWVMQGKWRAGFNTPYLFQRLSLQIFPFS